jgi:hypothetical protein
MTIIEKYCSSCGESIKVAAEICPSCGVRQLSASTGGKSRGTAIILALLLGGVGGHKFYLGKGAQGILYLLFFWTFLPSIAAFIEMIIYITTSDEEFKRRYPS